MGKPTGFMDYERVDSEAVTPTQRIKNFNEFHKALPLENSVNRPPDVWTAVCRSASRARCLRV